MKGYCRTWLSNTRPSAYQVDARTSERATGPCQEAHALSHFRSTNIPCKNNMTTYKTLLSHRNIRLCAKVLLLLGNHRTVAIPNEPPHKTDKMTCTPGPAMTQMSLGIAQSDQRSCCPHEETTHRAPGEDSDQTRRMSRQVRVFAGRTVRLLVLSRCG